MSRADDLRSLLAERYPVKVPGIREHVWFTPEALTRSEAEAVAARYRRQRRACHAELLMAWVACRKVEPLRATTAADLDRIGRELFGYVAPEKGS